MRKLVFDGVDVLVYDDVEEFTRDYYTIKTEDNGLLPRCCGFACMEEREIAIYLREPFFCELLATVAHELGHIATSGYQFDPPDYEDREKKALHYEKFVVDAWELTKLIYDTRRD